MTTVLETPLGWLVGGVVALLIVASLAGWILEEREPYECPWDDFRFNYFRGKDDWTAARELVAWA